MFLLIGIGLLVLYYLSKGGSSALTMLQTLQGTPGSTGAVLASTLDGATSTLTETIPDV
jgi:hypothetical protein